MEVQEITDRQMELISAAGKILTASGVSGLTIKNLSKEMGFSESAVYRHFASKQEIIVAMLSFLAANMEERFEVELSTDLPADEKLAALMRSQVNFFATNPHFVVAVFSDGLMEESGPVNQAILRIMQVKKLSLAGVIAEGQQRGVIVKEVPPEQLLHIVMGAFRLLMFKWRTSNFSFDLRAQSEAIQQSILKLIKTQ